MGQCPRKLYYLEEESAPSWVNDAIEKALFTQGRLNCPRCNGRLGAFDFIGYRRCPCGQHSMPAIHIAKNRVDPCKTKKASCTEYHRSSHKFETPNIGRCMVQDLTQTEHSDSTEVCETGSVDLGDKPVLPASCPKKTPRGEMKMTCLNAASDSNFLQRSNASSAGTYWSNKSLPVCTDTVNRSLPTVEDGHNQSLPAGVMTDRSMFPSVEDDATQMTKTDESEFSCDGNQFSVLASQQTLTDSDEALSDVEVITPPQDVIDRLTCSVCLSLFHEPHSCEPCGHVFCSSCLRRLHAASGTATLCPLCRSVIRRCFLHIDFDDEMKTVFPDEVDSRTKLERKTQISLLPLPCGQLAVVPYLRGRQSAPGAGRGNYFATSVCLVLLLTMVAFTILATTVSVIMTYVFEMFVDTGVELLDDVNWLVSYATQMVGVYFIEGTVPQELRKLCLARVHRIIDNIARIANRTIRVGDEGSASRVDVDVDDHRGLHTSYYTQYMLSRMAQANVANTILLSCLGMFLVYKLVYRRPLNQ